MLQMLRKRLNKDEEGFTLIELMVVVLIIAILLAIAIPTFLGARSRAQNRASESNLRNALTAEKTAYTDNQSYVANTAVQTVEPSLSFVAGAAPTAGSNQVEVTPADSNNVVCLLAASNSGTYYEIVDVAQVSTNFKASGTYYASGDSTLTCPTAVSAAGVPTGDAGGANVQWGNTTSGGGW
jgi:type IV pilus assembly protein PilA